MNEETLSSFWRRRRSIDRPIALRDLQLELTYLARLILKDQNINIAWHQSLVEGNGKTLILDSTPVEDVPDGIAVPDERVDALVGDTVYRAYLEALDRDKVYGAASQILASSTDPLIGRKARTLAAVKHLKAYFTAKKSSPAVREYVDNSRTWKKEHIKEISDELIEACSQAEVSYQDVIDLWSMYLLYDTDMTGIRNPEVLNAMVAASRASYGLVQRDRLTYAELLKSVEQVSDNFLVFKDKAEMQPSMGGMGGQTVQSPKGQSSPDDAANQDSDDSDNSQNPESSPGSSSDKHGSKDDSDDEDNEDQQDDEDESDDDDNTFTGTGTVGAAGGKSQPGKPDSLAKVRESAKSEPMVDAIDQMASIDIDEAEDIRQSIEFSSEDITQETLGANAGSYRKIIWEKAPYDQALETKLRTEAYSAATGITQILQRFKRMRSRTEHGTADGYKVDSRRVGRIMYGNDHVFQKRTVIDKLDMALVLLLDSSGSINDDQWELILKTAAAFVQALSQREDVDLIVASYTDGHSRSLGSSGTMIERHYDKKMKNLHAKRKFKGGTPSGEALAAIRESIFKRLNIRKKDKIVIHLTDGQPNYDQYVEKQVELNKAAGIETFCILVNSYRSSYTDQEFKDVYGNNFKHLDDYKSLLKCLTDLFGKITEVR